MTGNVWSSNVRCMKRLREPDGEHRNELSVQALLEMEESRRYAYVTTGRTLKRAQMAAGQPSVPTLLADEDRLLVTGRLGTTAWSYTKV